MATARPRVSIRVVRADGGAESQVFMSGSQLLCGRTGDLPLPNDPFVAETQFRLFYSGGKLAVEDVGAHNGVFSRLRQERQLSGKSEIRVGRERLVVEEIKLPMTESDGTLSWGSTDPDCRFRLVQQFEGGAIGSAFLLKQGENHLGREKGDITFPNDGFVSGKHAIITVNGDRISIRDLGSANGTFARLTAPAFVENNDQFLVGSELLRVEVS